MMVCYIGSYLKDGLRQSHDLPMNSSKKTMKLIVLKSSRFRFVQLIDMKLEWQK